MNEKHHAMTKAPVGPLILRLSIPNTLGLLVVSAYSLADSFFVSDLGGDASAAVGLTFSLHVLMQAVGYTLGMGAGTLLSHAMGRGEEKSAFAYATVATILSVLIGALITLTGLLFRAPLLRFLGASESLLPTALSYVTPLLWSAPAMCTAFVLSQLLRAKGRAVASMVGLMTGSLLNIALDPVLISLFGLGIKGASLATLISQSVGCGVLLLAFRKKRGEASLFSGIKLRELRRVGSILVAGLPSLFRQGLSGVATVLLNRTAAELGGDDAVSAISLVARLFLLLFSVCLGIGQGMLPVVGYNAGAGNPDRMHRAYAFSMKAATLAMLLLSIPILIYAPQVLTLLGCADQGLSLGVRALRAQSLVLAAHGVITSTILYLQATKKSVWGTVLAAARQGIFFVPLLLLLPFHWGREGLVLIQPIADLCTLLLSIPLARYAFRATKG